MLIRTEINILEIEFFRMFPFAREFAFCVTPIGFSIELTIGIG